MAITASILKYSSLDLGPLVSSYFAFLSLAPSQRAWVGQMATVTSPTRGRGLPPTPGLCMWRMETTQHPVGSLGSRGSFSLLPKSQEPTQGPTEDLYEKAEGPITMKVLGSTKGSQSHKAQQLELIQGTPRTSRNTRSHSRTCLQADVPTLPSHQSRELMSPTLHHASGSTVTLGIFSSKPNVVSSPGSFLAENPPCPSSEQ